MQPIEQWVIPSSVPQGLQISFIKVIVSFPGHKSPRTCPFILAQLFLFRLSDMNHVFSEDSSVRTSLIYLVIFLLLMNQNFLKIIKKIQRHASMVTYTLRSDLTSSSFSSWMTDKCEILTRLFWSSSRRPILWSNSRFYSRFRTKKNSVLYSQNITNYWITSHDFKLP